MMGGSAQMNYTTRSLPSKATKGGDEGGKPRWGGFDPGNRQHVSDVCSSCLVHSNYACMVEQR